MAQIPRVDYDMVASTYDQRVRGGVYLSGLNSALENLARQINALKILDLGCGTGRSLEKLASSLPWSAICYGLDFSKGMLTQARRLNPNYRLVRASAPLPPFSSSTFDLVFCVHAFHHFPEKFQVVQSAYSILRPGGTFAIVNVDPRERRQSYWIYDYFEGTYETDLSRFPSSAELGMMLHQVGFQQVDNPVVETIEDSVMDEAIFNYYYLRKDSSSTLILLSEMAYQAGLNRIRARVSEAKSKGENVSFRTKLINRMWYGFKPV